MTRMTARHFVSLALVLAATAACRRTQDQPDPAVADSVARARQDSINRAQPGYIIDSILPIEEQLRRFRADIAVAPGALAGGGASRDALVRRFVRSLETRDTTALVAMLLSRSEFAWLVYPGSQWTVPPYRQAPGLVWMLATRENSTGLSRLLERLGGRALHYQSYACGAEPERLGENRIWRGCTVRLVRSPGDTASMRLFAGIIERGGQFKIYSYGNDL
ncbi:MAG TPA: hypothetical protein VF981_14575 [Gemmatimonadaceae bacterium]